MTTTKDCRSGFSRRSFLKGSLAAAALTTGGVSFLTGCAPQQENSGTQEQPTTTAEEQLFSGVCRGNCYGGCFLNVHVRDGKVVRTSMRELPEPAWNRICAKGLSHVFRVYDPERTKYPMKRVGERGAGEWEQISWGEAFDMIADKFKSYAEEFGPGSVTYWYGSGNDAFVNNIDRFMNRIGANKVFQQLDMAIFYSTVKSVGVSYNFNGNELTDLVNAKNIVIWGANPAVSQMQGMHFLLEARDAGAKLISIDPVYSATTSKCDQWIPITPGTDGLLAMAIMNIIIAKGWQNVDFLKQSTVAPFLVKASDGKFLRLSDLDPKITEEQDAILVTDGQGKFAPAAKIADPAIEGIFEHEGISVTCAYTLLLERLVQYPIEDASRICGVPVGVIEGLAEDLAVNTPSTIYMCLGLDHYYNGFYSMFDICCIPALTGSIGKPGAFCGNSEALFYLFNNPEAMLGAVSENAVGSQYTIPTTNMLEVMENKEFLGEPLDIKALYVCRANVLANMSDRQYTLKWLDKVEFLVVTEQIMNETARYADLVLPVCHWFEQEDVGATYPQNAFLEYQEKAIDPLYESKSDFDIIKALAEKMGFGDEFDFTPGEFLDDKFDFELCESLGINYENMVGKKAVRGLPGSAEKPFIHGEGGIFPTTTGRLQFYDEAPAINTDFGQDYDLSNETLPYWEPPLEAPVEGHVNEKYPFQILSDHQKLRTHSQWAKVSAVLELDPEPTVKLHPETAQSRGIVEGDTVRIFNDRGYVVLKAHMSSGVRPGILLCSRGWDSDQFIDGHYQDVMTTAVNPICVTQAFFDNAGGIEKVEA